MAFYRKRSLAKGSRYRRYRRFNRRYRRSRYGRSRRYSRYRRISRKTEVKYSQYSRQHFWNFRDKNAATGSQGIMVFAPGRVCTVPTSLAMPISVGAGQGQRIGAKINPVKLRINGVITYEYPNLLDGSYYHSGATQPADLPYKVPVAVGHAIHVRCVVYQIKGGRTDGASPNSGAFHPLDIPILPSTTVIANEDEDNRVSADGLRKLLEDYDYTNNAYTFNEAAMRNNMGSSKSPFRKGIGGYVKVLYQKTFVLQTGEKTSYPFRFVTKKPRRIVWPEAIASGQDINLDTHPRNPVYILWYVVPQSPLPSGYVFLKQNVELFYSDN